MWQRLSAAMANGQVNRGMASGALLPDARPPLLQRRRCSLQLGSEKDLLVSARCPYSPLEYLPDSDVNAPKVSPP